MIKKWLKQLTGVAAAEAAADEAENRRIQEERTIELLKEKTRLRQQEADQATNDAILAKMTPRDRATSKGESWVAVLDTKVNPDNIRNGFFELDWNDFFINDLIANGYGTESDPQEEIVDRWFRDIVYQMLEDEGMDTSRGAGFINVTKLPGGKSEVS